jgi:hypothetical protein
MDEFVACVRRFIHRVFNFELIILNFELFFEQY